MASVPLCPTSSLTETLHELTHVGVLAEPDSWRTHLFRTAARLLEVFFTGAFSQAISGLVWSLPACPSFRLRAACWRNASVSSLDLGHVAM